MNFLIKNYLKSFSQIVSRLFLIFILIISFGCGKKQGVGELSFNDLFDISSFEKAYVFDLGLEQVSPQEQVADDGANFFHDFKILNREVLEREECISLLNKIDNAIRNVKDRSVVSKNYGLRIKKDFNKLDFLVLGRNVYLEFYHGKNQIIRKEVDSQIFAEFDKYLKLNASD